MKNKIQAQRNTLACSTSSAGFNDCNCINGCEVLPDQMKVRVVESLITVLNNLFSIP
jgi:hypothetical protein